MGAKTNQKTAQKTAQKILDVLVKNPSARIVVMFLELKILDRYISPYN